MPFPGLWGRFNRILMVKKQRFSMWFLQWVSLANTVLPTEIIICRFADEWGGVPPPHTPPVAPPLYSTRHSLHNYRSTQVGAFIIRQTLRVSSLVTYLYCCRPLFQIPRVSCERAVRFERRCFYIS